MTSPRNRASSPSDADDEDEQFFDANSFSSLEDVLKQTNESKDGIVNQSAIGSNDQADQESISSCESEIMNHQFANSTQATFATPKAPPRRKKKEKIQPLTSDTSQVITGVKAGSEVVKSESEDVKSQAGSSKQAFESQITPPGDNVALPLCNLMAEMDIASIHGDLLVDEALINGDKHSICVDNMSHEKLGQSFDQHRFKYELKEEDNESQLSSPERKSDHKQDKDQDKDQEELRLQSETKSQSYEESEITSNDDSNNMSPNKSSLSQIESEITNRSHKILDHTSSVEEQIKSVIESLDQGSNLGLGSNLGSNLGLGSKSNSRNLDKEILEQVMIKNLETGETMPLSKADANVTSKCINPLDLHLMARTNERCLFNEDEDEDEDQDINSCGSIEDADSMSTLNKHSSLSSKSDKTQKLGLKAVKNLKKVGKFGKDVFKGVKNGVERHRLAREATADQVAVNASLETAQTFRIKINKKKNSNFNDLKLSQELSDCKGAIWVMKWSVDGQLVAVAGQDQLLRVYCCSKAWKYFTQLRSKASGSQVSPASTKDRDARSSGSRSNSMSSSDNISMENPTASGASGGINSPFSNSNSSRLWSEDNTLSEEGPLLLFSAYRGHTADVLDVSWSKNHFLLSSSMDKTVRLWHVTRVECLCTLRHSDFVTTIQFHPRDDRYFLSGSLDGKLRLWNIPEKRVSLWNEVSALQSQTSITASSLAASVTSSLKSGSSKSKSDVLKPNSSSKSDSSAPTHGLITASAFVQNGKFAVIGTYDGRVIFFSTDQLKYFTQLHVSAKSGLLSSNVDLAPNSKAGNSSSQNSHRRRRRRCNKVTGIEGVDENKILVTTNDSRIRLYDLRDLSLACKYKGLINVSSQIRASVSHDNKYLVCGSENSSFYIWKVQENTAIGQRRDKNDLWESVRILSSAPSQPEAILNSGPANPNPPGANASTSGAPGGAASASGLAANASAGISSSNTRSHAPPSIITAATFAPCPKFLDEEATYVLAVADFNGTIRVFMK